MLGTSHVPLTFLVFPKSALPKLLVRIGNESPSPALPGELSMLSSEAHHVGLASVRKRMLDWKSGNQWRRRVEALPTGHPGTLSRSGLFPGVLESPQSPAHSEHLRMLSFPCWTLGDTIHLLHALDLLYWLGADVMLGAWVERWRSGPSTRGLPGPLRGKV